jgi:hypothetical protein
VFEKQNKQTKKIQSLNLLKARILLGVFCFCKFSGDFVFGFRSDCVRDRESPKRFLGSRCGSASHRPKNGDDCSTQILLCFERDRERLYLEDGM